MANPTPRQRRARQLGPCLVVLLTIYSAAAAAQQKGRDWPQFLGPARNAVAGVEQLPPWPAGGPPVLWKMPIGHGFAGPVVSDGKVILFHRAGNEEVVQCMDA